jgi:hypothetical protein
MDRVTGPLDFPVYIPTRGRPQKQLTADALLELGIRPFLVVEAAEEAAYKENNPECYVIVWPQNYLDDYEKTPELDPHPTTGAAHNYAWDHSRAAGYTHHWIMDDNIRGFLIRSNGRRANVKDAKALHYQEDFIRKFKNLAGISLAMAPFMRGSTLMINTRLYCATLYRNDLHEYGIKWRRGINDDTIVSLDILKTGYWCTAENRAVGIKKTGTSRKSRMAGGMTDFYAQGGFIKKSAELVRCHPEYSTTVVKFNRVHHSVDFSSFKQKLIPIDQTKGTREVVVEKIAEVRSKKPKIVTPKKPKEVSPSLQVGIDLVNQLLKEPRKEVCYPIYIPSKGRADSITTAGLLQKSGVPFKILVEPQDFDSYSKNFKQEELLLMEVNNGGIDYARNFAKAHSTALGAKFHWQFDDDIQHFRFRIDNKNKNTDPAHVINLVESVTNLYTNIGTAAPMYDTYAFAAPSPIRLNKMVASAMLFNNEGEQKFRPMIIDDIDMTMQYLDAGLCTLLFSTALVNLPTTPNDTGGMGAEARVGNTMRIRCENLVKQWGDVFKVITKNNAPRIAPSTVWSTFKQQPILKETK